MAEATLSYRTAEAAKKYTDAGATLLAECVVSGKGGEAVAALREILNEARGTATESVSEDPNTGRPMRVAKKANRDAIEDRGQAYADMVARLETGWREIG